MKAMREHLGFEKARPLMARRFHVRRFDCPYHFHPEAELTLIVKGSGQRLVGDHLASFAPGDLVFMGPNLPHTYFHAPEYDEGPGGAVSLVFQFRLEALSSLLELPECGKVTRFMASAGRGFAIGGATRKRVISLMEQVEQAEGWRRWAILLEILGQLAESRDREVLASEVFRAEANQRQTERIERVCAWITDHFRDPVTLEAAAAKAHMTPAAFSRFFHRATNRTFVHFVNELRIGHASRLLIETEQSVAEVAFASGFENLSNFNRRFLQLRSLTPTAYRERATQVS